MGIKSDAFGGVTLTEQDAEKFEAQIAHGKPRAAAVEAARRGVTLSRELASSGGMLSLKIGPKPVTRPANITTAQARALVREWIERNFVAKVGEAAGKLEDTDAVRRWISAYRDVLAFYVGLKPGWYPTHAAVSSDGECILEWRVGDNRAIASFEGEGAYGVALVEDSVIRPASEDGQVVAVAPDLAAFLQRNIGRPVQSRPR